MRRWGWVLTGLLLAACGGSVVVPTNTPSLPTAPVATTVITVTQVVTVTPATAAPVSTPAPLATNTPVTPPPALPSTPVPSPPTVTPIPPTATALPEQYQFTATVSNSAPRDNTTVIVSGKLLRNGSGVAGVTMIATWHYKTTTSECAGGPSAGDGLVSCSRYISRATPGFTVRVDVRASYQGRTFNASTSFTPV